MAMINLMLGDCLEQIKTLADNSVDSIVTDPPYGISFMAKKWDYDVPSVKVWREAVRVLKPGGHALIACGTRTQHRMVCNIEDAGFEIRDVVSWIYGSGFPKSLNISKAIDKAAGAEREVGPIDPERAGRLVNQSSDYKTDAGWSAGSRKVTIDPPATAAAKQWDGWGTALKPACEFFTLCRKPLSESTVAKNVLKWGTGGINVDGCRVEGEKPLRETTEGKEGLFGMGSRKAVGTTTQGRFPANLIHDGSQEVTTHFPNDSQRFFYCPKASKKDRNEGCEELEEKFMSGLDKMGGEKCGMLTGSGNPREGKMRNNHPTVKPTALMAYLCRLITPIGGIVLDPYMGSGSTGKAAIKEGFGFIGIERDEVYFNIAKKRIEEAQLAKLSELPITSI